MMPWLLMLTPVSEEKLRPFWIASVKGFTPPVTVKPWTNVFCVTATCWGAAMLFCIVTMLLLLGAVFKDQSDTTVQFELAAVPRKFELEVVTNLKLEPVTVFGKISIPRLLPAVSRLGEERESNPPRIEVACKKEITFPDWGTKPLISGTSNRPARFAAPMTWSLS